MKKAILIGIFLILAAGLVSAADFNVSVTSAKDNIDIDESAQFVFTILNNLDQEQNIKVYSPEVEWSIPEQVVKVYANSESNVKVTLTPTKYVDPGMYGIKINLKEEDSGELVEQIVFVNVRPPGEAISAYKPSVSMEVDIPKVIDPTEAVLVTVILENQNTLYLPDLVLRVTSDIDAFDIEQDLVLESLGKKAVELSYNLDPLQEPGTYKVNFEVLKGKEVIESGDPEIIEISTISPDFEEDIQRWDVPLLRTKIVATYTSNSNAKDTQVVKFPVNVFTSIITSTRPKSETIKEDGQKYKAIALELEPGQSRTIYVITDYWIPLVVLVVILLGLFIYFKYKSPVKIRKGISDVQTKEGGVSELKIMLEVTNTSKKAIKHVSIIDYVPNIADLSQEFIEGTLKPTKILKHEAKGTVLKWEIEEIAPGEDRLLSYDVKSKLSIIGNFRLPRAKIIFKRKGKEVHVYSNSMGVSA
jgi:hypothetical protein